MTDTKVTKDSWDIEPMIESRLQLPFERSFTQEETDLLSYGHYPNDMGEKWFIYMEEDTLYFHRSWSGKCIYVVTLEPEGEGAKVKEAWSEYDQETISERPLDEFIANDLDELNMVIDSNLLYKNTEQLTSITLPFEMILSKEIRDELSWIPPETTIGEWGVSGSALAYIHFFHKTLEYYSYALKVENLHSKGIIQKITIEFGEEHRKEIKQMTFESFIASELSTINSLLSSLISIRHSIHD